MAKYKVVFDGWEEEEVFGWHAVHEDEDGNTVYDERDYRTGAEIQELSNPGDYPYDPSDDPDFEIIEVDD